MSESTDVGAKTIPWKKVLIAGGIVLAVFLIFRAGVSENAAARERTASTMGVITKIKSGYDREDKEDYYYFTVEFRDTDYRKFTATSSKVTGKKGSKRKEGDYVKVAYEPANPSNNKVYIE